MDLGGGAGERTTTMTLELDDEDYELLGYGAERVCEVTEFQLVMRRAQVRSAWRRYAESPKGREAIRRKEANRRKRNPEKDNERKLRWYHADPERKARIRAQQAEWRKKNPDYMKNYAKRRREKRDE